MHEKPFGGVGCDVDMQLAEFFKTSQATPVRRCASGANTDLLSRKVGRGMKRRLAAAYQRAFETKPVRLPTRVAEVNRVRLHGRLL